MRSPPEGRPLPQEPSTPHEPRTKGERTGARILDSAAELFARSGFSSVSLREIAAHAGLTHAGLLHHFPGKEALLLEVLARRDAADAAKAFPRVLGHGTPEPSPTERLRLLVEFVARNSRAHGIVALYAKVSAEATAPDHPAHPYFVARYRRLREQLGALLEALFATADPPVKAEPGTAAVQLIALMDGLQTQWLLEPDAVPMEALVRDFLGRYGLHVTGSAEDSAPGPVTG
ncbi:TetR family transcriptional regulator [Streptomyces sp. CB01635]|uniref:TetR/AcrR family transcriptional regulator n=1 Tax=Streptomyces sp. CB01635 TaxID=2020326 RepID=UPI000C26F088|nr:TetR family transcriptional regulator [Streptomyces sp. CB01635]